MSIHDVFDRLLHPLVLKMSILIVFCALIACFPQALCFSFLPPSKLTFNSQSESPPHCRVSPSSTSLNLLLPSDLLATASADIDSMSDDVYGPVFAGGIALMFAGIGSAFVVGNIIPDEVSIETSARYI